MNDELKKLKVENERLRSQLEALLSSNEASENIDEVSVVTPRTEKIIDRDPEENEKILEIIKEVEEANIKGKEGKVKAALATKKTKPATKATPKPKAEKKPAVKSVSEDTPPPKAAKKKKTSPAKSKAPTKAKAPASKRAQKAPAGGGKKDWSQLSDSTLKRKTVAQLTEYLSDQGVSKDEVKDMKKSDMIAAVRAG